jgi:hypothetical protein
MNHVGPYCSFVSYIGCSREYYTLPKATPGRMCGPPRCSLCPAVEASFRVPYGLSDDRSCRQVEVKNNQ